MISKSQLARHQLNFAAGRVMHLAAFSSDLESTGTLLTFDWAAWHPTAQALLEDPAACARLSMDDCRKLLTFIVRLDRYKPGSLAQTAQKPAFDALLKRLEVFCR